jgi:hypothetical protein
MSDILDKLNSLKENVIKLNEKIDSTNLENKAFEKPTKPVSFRKIRTDKEK